MYKKVFVFPVIEGWAESAHQFWAVWVSAVGGVAEGVETREGVESGAVGGEADVCRRVAEREEVGVAEVFEKDFAGNGVVSENFWDGEVDALEEAGDVGVEGVFAAVFVVMTEDCRCPVFKRDTEELATGGTFGRERNAFSCRSAGSCRRAISHERLFLR
jgi:hypothetical protein